MIKVQNKIVDNVFSESELSNIYEHISNTPEDRQQYQDVFAQTAYFSWMPENIINKIVSVVNDNFDTKLILRELSFARYANTRGKNPLLFPHTDETFKEQRVTFDIQIKATKPWSIIVENEPYTLRDNQALFFSGTHQVHWREKLEFEDSDYVDMIFCHFSEENPEEISEEHLLKMKNLVASFKDQYDA